MAIEHLKTFLAVYRAGTMRAAAESLAMTQPAVSQQVATLEQQLGARLFERSRRGVTPTVIADGLARDIAQALDTLDQALASRRARTAAVSGLVHIGATAELFSVYGAKLVAAFSDTALQLEMHLGQGALLGRALEEGIINMAIVAQKLDDPRFAHHRLGEERLLLLAHPDLLRELRGRKSLSERLTELRLVTNSRDLLLVQRYWGAVFATSPVLTPSVVMPDLRSVATICAEVPAWTVLPDVVAGAWVRRGQLEDLLPTAFVATPLYLVWQRQSMRTSRVAFVVERIQKVW